MYRKKLPSQYIILTLLFILFISSCTTQNSEDEKNKNNIVQKVPICIIIHGGAGEIKPGFLSEAQEEEYKAKIEEALNAGYEVLLKGAKATDAVIASIKIMEDSPLFNAGKGAVLNHEGVVSMDASIMRGSDLNAGAITGIEHIKNPILLARLVMDSSKHVFLSGLGAEKFASNYNLATEENDYFITPRRLQQLENKLGHDTLHLTYDNLSIGDKYGTVGCVALDADGNIAAGTSTGGMVNKLWGRIGDSPIIGAGTFADNSSIGISATGHGEYFIRCVLHEILQILLNIKG